MQPSPYTPGEVAREVPGRSIPLAEMDERLSFLSDLGRFVGRIRVEVAARGLGKTSLLREVQRRAEARGAVTVWVTAGEQGGLIAAIAAEVTRATATWKATTRRRLSGALEHVTLTVGVPGVAQLEVAGGGPAPERRPTGVREFEAVIRETVAAARTEHRRGLVLFVDEIQSADADGLRTLGYAWQHLQSEGLDVPAAVFAAGLPSSPEVIGAVITFSERFAYRPLQPLTDDAVALALTTPARALGVEWERAALDHAVHLAQGYPYSVQLIGDATWAAAGHPDSGAVLTPAHVATGERAMRADLDALFRTRWERATAREQDFLTAMAALGDDPVRRADIAAAAGLTSSELSVPRARLLDKGLIEVAGHGKVQFTIPGFAAFVRARAAEG